MLDSFLLMAPVVGVLFLIWFAYELTKRFINKVLFFGIMVTGYSIYAFIRLSLTGYGYERIITNPTFQMITLAGASFLIIGLINQFPLGKSTTTIKKGDEPDYKQIIHDLADAMHNLGETPLRKGYSNETVDLSIEEVYSIRSLMRTLRKLARSDMSDNMRQDGVPYQEVIAVINEVAQKNANPNVTSELITKIEDEADRQDFNAIREIIKSMSVRALH